MVQVQTKPIWSATAVVIASILFTPIVGGILCALNQKQFGSRRQMWMAIGYSILAFLWYLSIPFIADNFTLEYYYFVTAFFSPQLPIILYILSGPISLVLILVIPIAGLIYFIYNSQKSLQTGKVLASPWYDPSIFIMGILLTIPVAIALIYIDVYTGNLVYTL